MYIIDLGLIVTGGLLAAYAIVEMLDHKKFF
jgi:hypothetical protein